MTDSIRKKQRIQYQEGREAEYFFRKWTGAKNAPKQMERDHIDCILDGVTIDVKGIKKSHLDGYVLVEFLTVDGRPGWGSTKAITDMIAFQFPEGFYVVDRSELSRMAQKKTMASSISGKILRANNASPSSCLYKMVGRPGRKDVFTYITKEDLIELNPQFVDENGIH